MVLSMRVVPRVYFRLSVPEYSLYSGIFVTFGYINHETKKAVEAGKRIGIICTQESRALYPLGILAVVGSREHEETVAHNLFSVLRDFDGQAVDCIFSESFSDDRLGQAIMNRQCKAAGYHIIKV